MLYFVNYGDLKSFIQVELMDVKTDVQQDPVLGMTMHDENDGTVRNIRYRQASKIVEALFTAGCWSQY